jgi:hypothetical protein
MFDLCFGYCDLVKKPSYLYKDQFRLNAVVTGLDLSKSILDQNEVIVNYHDNGKINAVPAKHGIITVFKIDGEYYTLGLPTENPIAANQDKSLKASVGGMQEANTSVSLLESLEHEIALETGRNLTLLDFDIASQYVCHRVPDWNEWSVCFLKVVALSKVSYTLEELKEKVSLMNKTSTSPYGIYKLEAIIEAAKMTAGLPEGSSQNHKSTILNYYNDKSEDFVIFDNNAIAKLFENLTVQHLFPANRKLSKI